LKDIICAFQWSDDNRPVIGVGISRSANPDAPLWDVDVLYDRGSPMRTTIRAKSRAEARKFTKNRHPNATHVIVYGKHKAK